MVDDEHASGPQLLAGRPTSGVGGPPPGTAVLACRCGQVLSLDDMHRPQHGWWAVRSGPTIDPIRCRRCAGL